MLVITNNGPTVATNVDVRFAPPLQSAERDHVPSKHLAPLPPGRRLSWTFASGLTVFEGDYPKRFTATITGTGPLRPFPAKGAEQVVHLRWAVLPHRLNPDLAVVEVVGLSRLRCPPCHVPGTEAAPGCVLQGSRHRLLVQRPASVAHAVQHRHDQRGCQ